MSFVSRLLDRSTMPASAERGAACSGAIEIEPMRRRHLRAVMQIEQQSYPKPWSPGVFTAELSEAKAGRRVYLIAKIEGELVGYGGLMLVLDEGHVSNVAVDPRYRRRHIGARVLAELLWAAREHECVAVSLEVRVSNTAAQELYARFGFVSEGIRRKYYENVEDAIIMWCRDVHTSAYAARLREIEASL